MLVELCAKRRFAARAGEADIGEGILEVDIKGVSDIT